MKFSNKKPLWKQREENKRVLEEKRLEKLRLEKIYEENEQQEFIERVSNGLMFSYAAYNKPERADDYLKTQNYKNFIFIDRFIGTQVLCCIKDRRAYIAIRGTNSFFDVIIDLLLIPFYVPLRHFGFGFSWRKVRGEIGNWLDQHQQHFDSVSLYGHSLGGAIAHVAALELNHAYEIKEVITFGSPRVYFFGANKKYDETCILNSEDTCLRDRTLRVVNKLDMITTIPYKWMQYSHVGQLVYLSEKGHVVRGEEASIVKENEELWSKTFRFLETPADFSKNSARVKKLSTLYANLRVRIKNAGEMFILIKIITLAFMIFLVSLVTVLMFAYYIVASLSSHLKSGYGDYFSTDSFERALEPPEPHWIIATINYVLKLFFITVSISLLGWSLYVVGSWSIIPLIDLFRKITGI